MDDRKLTSKKHCPPGVVPLVPVSTVLLGQELPRAAIEKLAAFDPVNELIPVIVA